MKQPPPERRDGRAMSGDTQCGDTQSGDTQPPTDSFLRHVLGTVSSIAVVGASPDPCRPSHGVMAFLLERGYRILPVNPRAAVDGILGQPVYQTLDDVPPPVHMVDVFRRSEAAGAVVDDAIRLRGAKGILGVWMQLGVQDQAAAIRARSADLWLWCMDLRISISGSASVFESLSCLSSSTHRVATISPEPSTGS